MFFSSLLSLRMPIAPQQAPAAYPRSTAATPQPPTYCFALSLACGRSTTLSIVPSDECRQQTQQTHSSSTTTSSVVACILEYAPIYERAQTHTHTAWTAGTDFLLMQVGLVFLLSSQQLDDAARPPRRVPLLLLFPFSLSLPPATSTHSVQQYAEQWHTQTQHATTSLLSFSRSFSALVKCWLSVYRVYGPPLSLSLSPSRSVQLLGLSGVSTRVVLQQP